MVPEALEARLKVLEDEILRLSKLASEAPNQLEQDKYWTLALDLQREARELRAAKSISEPVGANPTPKTNRTRHCDLAVGYL